MKTAIIYYSKHHNNTKKLLDAIADKHEVTLFPSENTSAASLAEYDFLGFASGIYYSKFHKSVIKLASEAPEGKKVFFVYTYGVKKDGYTKAVRDALSGKKSEIVGEYGTLGFNTFGPFRLIGGIAKAHPDKAELDGAVEFYESITNKKAL